MNQFEKQAYEVRPAKREDRHVIRNLVRNGRINPTGLDWRRFLVASTATGEVIGCGQIKPHRDGTHELASIVVAPAWQGQGVGRAIIEGLLLDQRAPLYLTCRAHLGAFYERFGFRAVTDPDQMPTYFRMASKIINSLHRLRITPNQLLVMYWVPSIEGSDPQISGLEKFTG